MKEWKCEREGGNEKIGVWNHLLGKIWHTDSFEWERDWKKTTWLREILCIPTWKWMATVENIGVIFYLVYDCGECMTGKK